MVRKQTSPPRTAASVQAGTARDQKHDEQLIFDGVDRFDAREDLARHHPGERNKANRRHAVDRRHKAASQRVPDHGEKRLIARASQCKAGFDRVPSRITPLTSTSRPRLTPVMVLPRIIPNSGRA